MWLICHIINGPILIIYLKIHYFIIYYVNLLYVKQTDEYLAFKKNNISKKFIYLVQSQISSCYLELY